MRSTESFNSLFPRQREQTVKHPWKVSPGATATGGGRKTSGSLADARERTVTTMEIAGKKGAIINPG